MREPNNRDDVRGQIEAALEALSSSPEAAQTESVEYRDRRVNLPVIDLPLGLVYFNPDTHRIRAQRSSEPSGERALLDAPYGQDAQRYLHKLLKGTATDPDREDPAFTELRDSLAEHGQDYPGIITRSGVLINGNTRAAALRELGKKYIRVGVLPAGTGPDDIRSLELSLQLRNVIQRDYSFVNFLLAIDESVRTGRTTRDILREFRIKQATLDRAMWILGFIREAIERSTVEDSSGVVRSLRLVDFETHQGKLEELHRAYSALKSRPDEAEALREQRMLALALDKSKTDLRLIDPKFAETYMADRLPTPGVTAAVRTIPGTHITLKEPSQPVQRLREFTDEVLRTKALASSGPARLGDASVVAARAQVAALTDAIDDALDKAGRNARLQKRKVAAADRITDAVEDLKFAVQAIVEARSVGQFDAEDIEDALLSLRAELERLAHQVRISASEGVGDGTAWLLGASRTGN